LELLKCNNNNDNNNITPIEYISNAFFVHDVRIQKKAVGKVELGDNDH